MRFNYKSKYAVCVVPQQHILRAVIGGCLFVFLFSCSDTATKRRREFAELENRLDAISVESDANWPKRLEDVETLQIQDDEIRGVQELCASAYHEYADALSQMAEAETRLAELEKALATGNPKNLSQKHSDAARLIDNSGIHLTRSRASIRRCMEKRVYLKEALNVTRN